MITKNLNLSDGLVNGTTGILKHITYGTNMTNNELTALIVWLKLENINDGAQTRLDKKQTKPIDSDLTPIEREEIFIFYKKR